MNALFKIIMYTALIIPRGRKTLPRENTTNAGKHHQGGTPSMENATMPCILRNTKPISEAITSPDVIAQNRCTLAKRNILWASFPRVAVLVGQPGEANYKSNASDATVELHSQAPVPCSGM